MPLMAVATVLASPSLSAGDPLSLLIRSQATGKRSEWSAVPFDIAPRFLQDTLHDTRLFAPYLQQRVAGEEAVKVSLALGHGMQHVTPWITLSDAERVIHKLKIKMTAAGDALAAVDFEASYSASEAPPELVVLETAWEQALEHDLGFALGVLFFCVACAVLGLLWHTCSLHGGGEAIGGLLDASSESRYSAEDERDDLYYDRSYHYTQQRRRLVQEPQQRGGRAGQGYEVYNPYEGGGRAYGGGGGGKRE